jgi:hypothetical protein
VVFKVEIRTEEKMDNETLKEIKTEVTAIRQVINSDLEGVGHADDNVALDLRLQKISERLIAINSNLRSLEILLIVLIVVVFFK